jgi:glycosyltransferase involved in cell wall biosynthesis
MVPKNDFLIVVFAKDEQENIPFVLQELLGHYTSERIIFVLDGNLEPSATILSKKNVKFIEGPSQGKGAAIRAAIDRIEAEVLVFMDADGSHDPSEIKGLLDPLMGQKAEMTIASRFMGKSDELGGSFSNEIRLAGNNSGNFIINFLWNKSGKTITDAQNGFRGIRRVPFLALSLQENGFAIEQEMVIKCLKKGLRIVEIPSHERKRLHGQSHISNVYLLKYIKCLIRNIF